MPGRRRQHVGDGRRAAACRPHAPHRPCERRQRVLDGQVLAHHLLHVLGHLKRQLRQRLFRDAGRLCSQCAHILRQRRNVRSRPCQRLCHALAMHHHTLQDACARESIHDGVVVVLLHPDRSLHLGRELCGAAVARHQERGLCKAVGLVVRLMPDLRAALPGLPVCKHVLHAVVLVQLVAGKIGNHLLRVRVCIQLPLVCHAPQQRH
mmetsp:Transcript_24070/g.71454  ORF Transcript_24070/g.71454 Transcript_24070/m.71454 type:complete len:207 (+) Transcript_24070:384-1004(+)